MKKLLEQDKATNYEHQEWELNLDRRDKKSPPCTGLERHEKQFKQVADPLLWKLLVEFSYLCYLLFVISSSNFIILVHVQAISWRIETAVS